MRWTRQRALDAMWADAEYVCVEAGGLPSEEQEAAFKKLTAISNDPRIPLDVLVEIGELVRLAGRAATTRGRR